MLERCLSDEHKVQQKITTATSRVNKVKTKSFTLVAAAAEHAAVNVVSLSGVGARRGVTNDAAVPRDGAAVEERNQNALAPIDAHVREDEIPVLSYTRFLFDPDCKAARIVLEVNVSCIRKITREHDAGARSIFASHHAKDIWVAAQEFGAFSLLYRFEFFGGINFHDSSRLGSYHLYSHGNVGIVPVELVHKIRIVAIGSSPSLFLVVPLQSSATGSRNRFCGTLSKSKHVTFITNILSAVALAVTHSTAHTSDRIEQHCFFGQVLDFDQFRLITWVSTFDI